MLPPAAPLHCPWCSPKLPHAPSRSHGAPSKAALLPSLTRNGNLQSYVRGVYNVYIYIYTSPSIHLGRTAHSLNHLPTPVGVVRKIEYGCGRECCVDICDRGGGGGRERSKGKGVRGKKRRGGGFDV